MKIYRNMLSKVGSKNGFTVRKWQHLDYVSTVQSKNNRDTREIANPKMVNLNIESLWRLYRSMFVDRNSRARWLPTPNLIPGYTLASFTKCLLCYILVIYVKFIVNIKQTYRKLQPTNLDPKNMILNYLLKVNIPYFQYLVWHMSKQIFSNRRLWNTIIVYFLFLFSLPRAKMKYETISLRSLFSEFYMKLCL